MASAKSLAGLALIGSIAFAGSALAESTIGTGHYWGGSAGGVPGTGGRESGAAAYTGYDVPPQFMERSAVGTGHYWGGSSNGVGDRGAEFRRNFYGSPWPLPDTGGVSGYYGGSSGGIPGTGAPGGFGRGGWGETGILPEDRPFPAWATPSRWIR
ncbi:MAG TPA: hypothetical protein VKV77_02270 [Methylovirgula sp.]|nr:hypothetical protein [Methylovirgula sp.]